jgi:hypothetical protein
MLTRREALQAAAAVTCAALAGGGERLHGGAVATTTTSPASQPAGPWFRRSSRVFLLDFQMPDPIDQSVPGMPQKFFEKLEPEKIVAQLAATNVNTLLVHAKDNQGNAYYNSKAAHKHSQIGGRDLMAEFSKLCRAKKLNLLFYVQLTRERRSFEHDDRRARDANGKPVVSKRDKPLLPNAEEAPVVCLNGPHRQYIKDILSELSREYDFDGFWLDCFAWWGRVTPCYCDACKAAYRKDLDREIPKKVDSLEFIAYLRWRRRLNSRLMHELQAHIRAINPKLTITHNGSGVQYWADWDFCDRDDYPCEEFHYNEGPAQLALTCRQNRALRPTTPFEIEVWRFSNRLGGGANATSRGYQVRPTATLLMEMSAACALGGFPQYYDQVRPDGTLEPRSLERVAPALAEVAKRQPFTFANNDKLQPVPYAAILWSKTTESFGGQPMRELHQHEMEGTLAALVESHVPAWLLSERDVAAGEFRGAKVLIIGSAEILPRELIAPIEKFVEAGGGLVVTGRTGLRQPNFPLTGGDESRDAKIDTLDNFALANLIGLDFAGMTETLYTYLAFPGAPATTAPAPATTAPAAGTELSRDLALDFPMSVYESLQTLTKPRDGTAVAANIVTPMRGFHMGFPPHARTDFPAVTTRAQGKGRVAYFAAPVGALYKRFNHGDFRQLLLNATTHAAAAPPPVTARAPETVEIVAWRDPAAQQTILHILNRTGAGLPQGQGQLTHAAIPIHDIKITLPNDLAPRGHAWIEPEQTVIPLTRTDTHSTVQLPPVDVWMTVAVV